MADLTQERYTRSVGDNFPAKLQLGISGSAAEIFQGSMVSQLDADGLAVKAGAATSGHAIGIAEFGADNSGGSDGDISMTALQGAFWLNNDSGTAVVEADLFNPCFIVDDNTVSGSDSGKTRKIAGIVLAIDTTLGVLVYISAVTNAATEAEEGLGGLVIQTAGGTFVTGTADITAGITVTAATDAYIVMSAVVTGSTNLGGQAHLKASNVAGAPGVGAVTLNLLGDDGAVDADAAGAFRVLLIN